MKINQKLIIALLCCTVTHVYGAASKNSNRFRLTPPQTQHDVESTAQSKTPPCKGVNDWMSLCKRFEERKEEPGTRGITVDLTQEKIDTAHNKAITLRVNDRHVNRLNNTFNSTIVGQFQNTCTNYYQSQKRQG